MAAFLISALLLLFITYLSATPARYYGPTCRNKSVFPYVTCGEQLGQCFSDYNQAEEVCAPTLQFGCEVQPCDGAHPHDAYTCGMHFMAFPCPDGEIPVRNVSLRYDYPASIKLRMSPVPPTVDVILLIDATASVRPHLEAIKPQLISFLNSIDDGTGVGVAVYGSEQSFDSSGKSVLSAVDEDVNKAIQALDRIPQYADGPRTTLRALEEIRGSDMGTRGQRQIVFLIGDSPGREPECGTAMTRDMVATDIYGYGSSVSVVAVSVGQPGLDASLPEPPACPNSPYINTAAVSEGQATFLASNTAGAVIDAVSAESLRSAWDTVRRNPLMPGAGPPGSSISVTTARLPIYYGPFTPPRQEYTNGCEDAVLVETDGIPDFISAPNVVNATVTLKLQPGVCSRGVTKPCEVRIREHVNTAQIPNSWSRPLIIDEILYVYAC